jgi:hypothetical protein
LLYASPPCVHGGSERRVTLRQLSVFGDISRKTYRTSDIPDWNRFDLDRSIYADHAIEPSLYMEAQKPSDSALLQSPSRADIFTQP